jgi:predicted  nucleic acid-binding Zn-ribbon protein
VSQAQTNLTVLDQNIGTLSDRASTTSTAPDAIQTVKDRRADLDKKFSDLKNATEDQWTDAKAAFQKSYDSVKDAMKQTWNSLSGKS